jgi:hypothetical protein
MAAFPYGPVAGDGVNVQVASSEWGTPGPPAAHNSTGSTTTTIKLSINELHPLKFQKRQRLFLSRSISSRIMLLSRTWPRPCQRSGLSDQSRSPLVGIRLKSLKIIAGRQRSVSAWNREYYFAG